MCHGHPRWHPCSHTSINWHYCPSALIDLDTGVETPCTHLSYATAQPSNADCPLLNCQYKAMGGNWTCCQCGQGPNTQGWCTMPKPQLQLDLHGITTEGPKTCDHGCCAECAHYLPTRATTPDMTFSELRKGTASRKFGYSSAPTTTTAPRSHRRGSAAIFARVHGFLTVEEEEEEEEEEEVVVATLPSTFGCSSSQSSSPTYCKSSAPSSQASKGSVPSMRDSHYRVGIDVKEYSPAKRHKSASGKTSKRIHSSRAR